MQQPRASRDVRGFGNEGVTLRPECYTEVLGITARWSMSSISR